MSRGGLILKGIIGGLFQLVFFGLSLLVPARLLEGTLLWSRAIWFLAGYGIVLGVCIIWLALVAPASLAVRLQAPVSKSQPMSDRIVTSIFVVLLLAWLVFIPLEVFRLHLFPKPSLLISGLGGVLFLGGFGIVVAALCQNPFAASIIKVQQGQVVVKTGLYGLVRHPMYVGGFFNLFGLALFLESYASALASLLLLAVLVLRIFVEEKTLREKLPGYAEYMTKTRWRLTPFIW